jgi:CRISPR-associated endonuclease Csn1
MSGMQYRLALDLGSNSLGWAMIRLKDAQPVAIIKAGVRIFSDGRNPKDGTSLAVGRRLARAMRRRRDRLLKRKARMMALLLRFGFFPADAPSRKALEQLNPYELRFRGLDHPLSPAEFARALFHINQRRGFKSNRKTDRADNESGALKQAISALHQQIDSSGTGGKARTVGELLWRRMQAGQGVRARYREQRIETEAGKTRIDKSYDLYIDRSMVEAEFDALWACQARFNPAQFTEEARRELRDCLLHQRLLKPVKPGRCTLLPDEERAPLALPSQQRFRIYQEVNHLRILRENLEEVPLTLEQRDTIVDALERNGRRTFAQIKKMLQLPGSTSFNLEDAKRQELKGNATSATLGKKDHFGPRWFEFSWQQQDEIVMRLLTEENESRLLDWLQSTFGLDEQRAIRIANAGLPEGYGSLSAKALSRILPALQTDVISYDKAVQQAGFQHHSHISHAATTGEVLPSLPYYGEYLPRHVGFGSRNPDDPPEKRFGRIANPTVHIGLNQVRIVVNGLIKRYGHPAEVIIEVARDLKQSQQQRKEQQLQQAQNQKRNERLRLMATELLGVAPSRVKQADIQKLILWEELSDDVAERRCPYSGVQIGAAMVLTDEVEVEHILPFSQTLDDSLNNKTVCMRRANRVKGNRTPWEARADFEAQGWAYDDILRRAERMPRAKRYRFAPDGYARWLKEDKDFLARALNDTRYLSRIAREYLSLICPQATRVIPGHMTALLRAKFGLNDILGLEGEKNRNDHRHHAVDACVIGVTDQSLLQRFAQASASARQKQLDRLVDSMPLPWPTYREHVALAVEHIWVSHKPDHGYEGGFADDTAYRPPHLDPRGLWRTRGIGGSSPNERAADAPMIPVSEPGQTGRRHQPGPDGQTLPYKGYMGGSNYCIEITRAANGKWEGHVISTYEAYRIVKERGLKQLRHPTKGQNGAPLIMRLVKNDCIRIRLQEVEQVMRVVKIATAGTITFAPVNEANVDARNNAKEDPFSYTYKTAGSLKKSEARQVTISPTGELHDPGFRE